MAVVKLTSSRKALFFIQDDGSIYSLSVDAVQRLIHKDSKMPFMLLTRMPYGTPYKFPPSPLYTPVGYIPPREGESVMSEEYKKRNKESLAYSQDVRI